MNPILFLSLVIILNAALPWWPYTASGRLRHHRPWDWVMERRPSTQEALKKAAMKLHAMQCDPTLQRQFAEYDTTLQMFAER
jgi:hypothetical protein